MSVKTALRVIEIIEIYAREKRPLSLSELARLTDVPLSSCLALIRTLTDLGYLYETGRRQGYYPTSRLLAMAQSIARADPVLDRVYPRLSALREATQETVVFAKLDGEGRVVYLDVLDSPHTIRYVAMAGEFREAHANSLGKALLSTLTPEARRALLARRPMTRYNARTLVTVEAIEAELAQRSSANAKAVHLRLKAAREAFVEVVEFIAANTRSNPNAAFAGSVPYLMLAGNLMAGWQLARSLMVAEDLSAQGQDVAFMQAKITTARFYADHILSRAPGTRDAIVEGAEAVTALAIESF